MCMSAVLLQDNQSLPCYIFLFITVLYLTSYLITHFCFQSVHVLEKEILKGQSFQGPRVAREIHGMLEKRDLCSR